MQRSGVQGIQGCLGGVQGVSGEVQGLGKNTKKPEKRFVQEVPVPNGSGCPLSVPAVAHPPPGDFKVSGGGKGEVKPLKCPTRQSGLADKRTQSRCYLHLFGVKVSNMHALAIIYVLGGPPTL